MTTMSPQEPQQPSTRRGGILKSGFTSLGARTASVNDLRVQGAAACILQLVVTIACPIVWYILVTGKDSRLLPVPIVSWEVTVAAAILGVVGFVFPRSLLLGLHAAMAVALAAALGAFHTQVYLLLADRCDRLPASFSGCSTCPCAQQAAGSCSRAQLDAEDCSGCKAWPSDVCSGVTKSGLPFLGLIQLVFVALPALFSLMLLVRLEKESTDLANRLMHARTVITGQLERLEAGRPADVEPGLLRQLLATLVQQGGPLDRAVARSCAMMLDGQGRGAGGGGGAAAAGVRDVETGGAPGASPGVMDGPRFALPSAALKKGDGGSLKLKSALRKTSAWDAPAPSGTPAYGEEADDEKEGGGGDGGGLKTNPGAAAAMAALRQTGGPQVAGGGGGAGGGGTAVEAVKEAQARETREKANLWAGLDSSSESTPRQKDTQRGGVTDASVFLEDPVVPAALPLGSRMLPPGATEELAVTSFDEATDGEGGWTSGQEPQTKKKTKKKKKKKSASGDGDGAAEEGAEDEDKPKKRKKKKKAAKEAEEAETEVAAVAEAGESGAEENGGVAAVDAKKKKKKKKKLLGASEGETTEEEVGGGGAEDEEGEGTAAKKSKKKKKKKLQQPQPQEQPQQDLEREAVSEPSEPEPETTITEPPTESEPDAATVTQPPTEPPEPETDADADEDADAGGGGRGGGEGGKSTLRPRRRKKSNRVAPEGGGEEEGGLQVGGGSGANDMDQGPGPDNPSSEPSGRRARRVGGAGRKDRNKAGWVAA